jgi:hypothetical protein
MKLFLTPMARMIFGTTFFFSAAGLAGAQTTQPAATEPSGANMTVSTIAAVGTAAPDFSLLTNTGTHIRLSDYVGKQIVVLYFYPKAGTPGCTAEACAFRDALAAYDKADISRCFRMAITKWPRRMGCGRKKIWRGRRPWAWRERRLSSGRMGRSFTSLRRSNRRGTISKC